MNICCIDFDNVGIHGIMKAFDIHKEFAFQDFIIVGKHVDTIRISSSVLVQLSNFCFQNKCKLHFHNKDIKNSSDFLLCYYIGLYNDIYKRTQYEQTITYHIISGDTSFISLEEIEDINIKIHNIHLPKHLQEENVSEISSNIVVDTTDKIKDFIISHNIAFPINIKQLVKKLREHFGKKYHSHLGQDESLSKIKALKMYIKKCKYLTYEKRSNIVSLLN